MDLLHNSFCVWREFDQSLGGIGARGCFLSGLNIINERMNPLDLTANQLKRAAAIKERLEGLNKELRGILGAPSAAQSPPKKKRTMSASTKKQIAAAQKARWANLRRANHATRSVTATVKAKKKTVSAATKACSRVGSDLWNLLI